MAAGRAFVLALLAILFTFPADSQTPSQTPTPSVKPESEHQATQAPVTKRRRRKASHPAEFQGAGLLQLEYGYNGDFRARDVRAAQTLTLNLNFSLTDTVLIQFSNDNMASQTASTGLRQTGLGNTYLGFQVTTLRETMTRPALAFAYQATLPTASEAKGLSTVGVWHKTTALISKKVHDTDIDFNASLLVNGLGHGTGYDTGAQVAIGFSRDLPNHFGVQWEVSGQTLDADEPRGAFASAALTYQTNARVQFDAGVRFGLTPAAPRFGAFAGMTIRLANLYHRRGLTEE